MRAPTPARLRVAGALALAALSLALGLGTWYADPRPRPHCTAAEGLASSVLGWTYFSAWSASFWPQVVLNWSRRSVAGLSFDFAFLNAAGFACYAAFNLALFASPSVRAAYARAHRGHAPAVRAADVFFSVHAFALSSVTCLQIVAYPRGGQTVSRPCKAALGALGVGVPCALALALLGALSWLQLLYALSYVKLGVTLTKYVPQARLNCRRRSTEGWSIDNVVLDFLGGALSLGQLLLDAACADDWSAVSGDPVKFGLGFVSMVFDSLFLAQHFVCYRGRAGPGSPLLAAGAVRGAGAPPPADAARAADEPGAQPPPAADAERGEGSARAPSKARRAFA